MRPMSTEDFLREIVFRNSGNSSSSGTLLSGASGPMPPQAAGWQGTAPRQSLLGSPQAGSGASVFRMRCTTNHLGKIEAKEEHTPNESTRWEYTYDVAGHLATVRCNGAVTEEYTYNTQGQRIADRVPSAMRHRGGQRRFTYNDEGQLVEVNATHFYYTASDTLRGRQENGKNTYFSYGDDTRLDSVTLPSGFEVRYEYGQSLLPERIHVSGRLVGEYRWQTPLQLQEYYDVMQDTRYTFQYKGQRVPMGVYISGTGAAFIKERFQRGNLDQYSPMFQAQGATDSLFLHIGADQVGSIRTLSTEDGRMVKEIEYDSFGNVLRDSFPELSFPLGFAGGLVDEHTGFVRFGYRDYDPQTGRFTAQDPARDLRGDADLYDYCVDDPVSCVDPQGLATRQWNESLHPRDDVGKFTFKDGADNLPREMRKYARKNFTSTPYSYNIGEALQRATKGQIVDKMPVDDKVARFYLLADMLKEAADHLNIDPDYLMALASHESSWLNDHNFGLNNLFGLTNAGKNNLSFSSLGKSVEYWVKNYADWVSGSKSMEEFIHGLRYNGPNAYNSKDPKYDEKLRKQYKTIVKRKLK